MNLLWFVTVLMLHAHYIIRSFIIYSLSVTVKTYLIFLVQLIMATLKKLKQIDNRFKYAVFGYVRSMEPQLSHYNVPVLISYICLSYYYHNEYFAKKGDNVELSNNNMTVNKLNVGWNNTTYGNIWIESDIDQIAKWTFKLSSNGAWISILSKDNRINKDCLQSTDEPIYGFC